MQHKITDRQLMALLAVYCGEGPYMTADGLYGGGHEKAGTPVWRSHTNMGGAIRRMCDNLRDREFLTDWGLNSEREKPYYEVGNKLTAKGYEAIFERLGKLPVVSDTWREDRVPYDFNKRIDRAELLKRMGERRTREAEIKRLIEEERAETSRKLSENAKRYEAEKLSKLRKLFNDRGLADNWSDDELLAFADKVASI